MTVKSKTGDDSRPGADGPGAPGGVAGFVLRWSKLSEEVNDGVAMLLMGVASLAIVVVALSALTLGGLGFKHLDAFLSTYSHSAQSQECNCTLSPSEESL